MVDVHPGPPAVKRAPRPTQSRFSPGRRLATAPGLHPMARLGWIDSRSRPYPILFYSNRPAVSGRPLPSPDQRPRLAGKTARLLSRSWPAAGPARRRPRPALFRHRPHRRLRPPPHRRPAPGLVPASSSPPRAASPVTATPSRPGTPTYSTPGSRRPAASSPPSTTISPGSSAPRPPRPAPGSSKPSPPRAASPRPRPELPAKPFRLPVPSAASRALPPVAWPVGSFFASRRKWGAIKRRVRPPVSGLRD